jgi:hypothetical protein
MKAEACNLQSPIFNFQSSIFSPTRHSEFFLAPPDFFPRRAETIFVCLIIRDLSKTDYAGKLIFQPPPNFTPSAQKHFSRLCDNIVALGLVLRPQEREKVAGGRMRVVGRIKSLR